MYTNLLKRIVPAILIAFIIGTSISQTGLAAGNASPTYTDPVFCPSGGSRSALFADNMEGAAQWDFVSLIGVGHWGIVSGIYTSATHSLFGPDESTQVDSIAKMKNALILPSDTTAYLYFHHQFDLEKYKEDNIGYDGGVVEYNADGGPWTDAQALFSAGQDYNVIMSSTGSSLAGRRAFSGNSNGWVVSRYDLSNLAGKTVRFRFRTASDLELAKTGWYIDDVEIYTCPTNTSVYMGGNLKGSYNIGNGESIRQSYSLNEGPVKVVSTQNNITAERVNYFVNGAVVSYAEMMGLPNSQLDNTYWFPWYKNDSQINTQLRIGNVSGSEAHVHVYIAGEEVTGSPYTLSASGDGQSVRLSYDANNGPVKIVSDQNIVAAERVNYFVNGVVTSYAEMMGLPNSQLDNTYWFPWYKNDSQINTQFRIGNVSGSEAHVHIYIAGAEVTGSPYTLTTTGDTQSMRLSYNANNGPVQIVSDQNIVATERVNYFVNGVVTSYAEMMGQPNGQLDTTYWFPWYKNDSQINTQFRIGNVSGTTAHVHVYIGASEMSGSPYTLTASGDGQGVRLSYSANDGPVKIQSDQNIVATERVNYFINGVVTSYAEMMGLPNTQLGTINWFPWYKNDSQINTQLRIAIP